MATSKVDICSVALSMLGDEAIASFTENTKRAGLCAKLWPAALDTILRLHPWNCAIRRVALAPLTDAPVSEYAVAFELPADCLRLLEVYGITDYRLEGRTILCDAAAVTVRFVYRDEDAASYDALLTSVLQNYMAVLLAYPITKSNVTADAIRKQFSEMLKAAKAVDAQEEPGQTFGDFPLLNARRS